MAGDHQTALPIHEEQRTEWEEYVGKRPEFIDKAGLTRRFAEKESTAHKKPILRAPSPA